MKKIIITSFLLLFMVTISYSQDKTIVETISNTVSSAVDSGKAVVKKGVQGVKDGINTVDTAGLYRTMYEDAKSGIQGLASALKVGAEHVYKVLVMQQVVKSITW